MKLLRKLKSKILQPFHEMENRKKRIKFYSQFIKKNDLVFDIGANVGNRVEAFLNLGSRVVAVEPQENCCKVLKKKFKNNNDLAILQKGMGAKSGFAEFFESKSHQLSSFASDWIQQNRDSKARFSSVKWNKPQQMEIMTLDQLIEKAGNPAFVKIDVEGYEVEVLKGLSKSVKCLSFEYTTPEMSENLVSCLGILEKLNPDYMYNYSVGESMKFALPEWVNSAAIIRIAKSPYLVNSGFGDIYAKAAF